MKLTLPRFGLDEIEIDPKTLIEFPNGLPGFEDCKLFKLFHSEGNPVVFWLQSIDDTGVVFSLTDPDSLQVFYKMSLTDEELSTLQADADDQLQIAVILAKQEDNDIAVKGSIRANYTSPIVINVSKQIALQKILQQSEFSVYSYQPLSEKAPQAFNPSIPSFYGDSQKHLAVSDSLCSVAP